ncbi:quinoprotein relay system zinc metallohydrolase 2 [Poseidonocella sedimentorum]|uniref:Quinoprotein relay system zinc metallohydrolase 2 n=1 Tax=Poseidonocella sedimentorum TaxID=871652 RepID=A0A1I6D406_9RHOB|nr:quinoprotein relay system zinc metallohydrolase 2 [Poseidonocella sedimentorum]SFR00111.1 quinoprotein relay system zinc metallohydrolase 2 [Poseidonocella sedimentorum]
MFETLLTLCLAGAPEVCREALIPGPVHAAESVCVAALDEARAPSAPGLVPRGPPFCAEGAPGLAVRQIAPGVYVHRGEIAEPDAANRGDVANLGFVVGARSIAVIDSGTTAAVGEDLWRALREVSDLPVSHLILTHIHPDHALGAAVFADAGAEILGHARHDRAMADRVENYLQSLRNTLGPGALIGTRAVGLSRAIDGADEIDLGGRVLALRAWPPSHTGTDLTVLDRQTGTLFAGDLVFDGHTPALDGSLRGWLAVMEELMAEGFARVVPGHGGPVLDWPDGGTAQFRYLERLAGDTRAAIAEGQRIGEAVETIGQSEARHWALFDAYNTRNATVAFTELEWE